MSEAPDQPAAIEEPVLEAHPGTGPLRHSVLPLLEHADVLVYALVGLVFLVAALGICLLARRGERA